MSELTLDHPDVRRGPERPAGTSLMLRGLWLLITATLAVMTVFPLLWMVTSAFKGQGEIYTLDLLPARPTLDNFVFVLTQGQFIRWIVNTLVVATTVSLIALWFHSMAGYALARLRFRGRDTLFLLMFSTYLVSLPVILVPLFMLIKTLGWTNSYAALIIPPIFNVFGIFLLRQFYLELPRELEEAAAIDSAGYWTIYWHIILPLSRPILSTLFVMFFLANWNSFLWPLVSTTGTDMYLVQVGIQNFRSQHDSAQNYVMAASVIVALPTLILFLIFQRQLTESIKTSGIRG